MKTNIANRILYCNICGKPTQEITSTTGGVCRGHPNTVDELDDILKQVDIGAIADYWKALADKRRKMLKRLEWTPDELNDYYCPVCYNYEERNQGHTDDCELAEAIDGR